MGFLAKSLHSLPRPRPPSLKKITPFHLAVSNDIWRSWCSFRLSPIFHSGCLPSPLSCLHAPHSATHISISPRMFWEKTLWLKGCTVGRGQDSNAAGVCVAVASARFISTRSWCWTIPNLAYCPTIQTLPPPPPTACHTYLVSISNHLFFFSPSTFIVVIRPIFPPSCFSFPRQKIIIIRLSQSKYKIVTNIYKQNRLFLGEKNSQKLYF